MRDNVGGWVAKIFIGLLALSFAVWGIADVFSGYRGTALAVVGKQEITVDEFNFAFQRSIRTLSQRLGQNLTLAQARDLNIHRQVLAELISEAALDNQIAEMGLAVPDETIANRIANNPLFQTTQGQFNRTAFQQMLASNGLTETMFLTFEREAILRAEIAAVIDQNVDIPDAMISAIVRQQNETRTARYFVLSADTVGTIPEPNDAEQQAYYNENKRSFTAPEFRTLTLLRLEPEDVADTISISDEELRQLYDQSASEFISPETREIQQITFPTIAEAQKARERIADGTDFIDVAKERGLKPIDYNLGVIQRSELSDAKVSEAAFSLSQGAISDPIEGKLSIVLVRVQSIKPEEKRTFESVRDDLKKRLGLERAQEEILNLHDAVEDARAGGANLVEIGQKFDLPVIQVDAIDRSGNGPDGKPVADIPASTAVLSTSFESDVGVENDPVDTPNDGFVWVDVAEVTPQAIRPLDEVRDDVIKLWKTNRSREALIKRAGELVDQAKGGKTFEAIAQELGTTVTDTNALKRRDTAEQLGAPAVAALFRTPVDGQTFAQSADGKSLVILKVVKVETPTFDPNSAEAKAIRTQLVAGVGRDLFAIYVGGLQEDVGIEINEQLWATLHGES
ncbi:MAG: SurA N-terminal domain-containing protein [Hyphomicrobiales bacterium]